MSYGFYDNKEKADIEEIVDDTGETKVDKVEGKVLSDNDYTDTDKAIVDGATAALSLKVEKVTGKGLSTLDFTTALKTKADETSYNTFGTTVGLGYDGNNYYSSSSPYTCPHDGYVFLQASERSGYSQLNVKITSSITLYEKVVANSNYRKSFVFVKKGMKIYATTSGEDNFAEYYPQTSYS